jgi:mono/diheme cytochrome c family protein
MQEEKSSKLVKHLEHPNGWWRDTAQKLIILRGDKSVVPSLVKMASKSKSYLARVHAIWTLEGLDALEPSLLREKFHNEHPQVRIAAIRASETLFKKGDKSLVADIEALASDDSADVVIQTMMTANLLKWNRAKDFVEATMQKNSARGVQEIGTQLLLPALSEGREFSRDDKMMLRRGEGIYNELCFTCHGPDGKGMPLQGAAAGVTMAPPLGGSKTVTGLSDQIIQVLLKGLSGPVNEKKYDAQMVAMESNDDQWIGAVTSYVRNNFGNNASLIQSNDVARVRGKFKERGATWTSDELRDVIPQFLTNRASWKVSASHATDRAARAIDGKFETRYETGVEQVPGIWFQIELPEETIVSGLYLDAASSPHDYPRGYKVDVSNDGQHWKESISTGRGSARTTEIHFEPVKTKFIRITQTSSARGLFWSIFELQVLQPPDAQKIKTALAKKTEKSLFE